MTHKELSGDNTPTVNAKDIVKNFQGAVVGKTRNPVVAIFFIIFVPSFLSSYTGSTKPDSTDPDIVWGYGPISITNSYQSSKDPNNYDGNPYTRRLCLFQLREPNVFIELSKSKDGLMKNLEFARVDISVAGFACIIF